LKTLFFPTHLDVEAMKIFAAKCGPLVALLLLVSGFVPQADARQSNDSIVEIAASADQFSTLVAAVKAAGLVDTLNGDGPFTVFAPTNDAFGALPAGTVEELLKPENRDQLISILTYHVVPGRIAASDLLSTMSAETVNGQRVPVGLRVGEANVIATDIEASNGIIHVIDGVLLPPAADDATARAMRMIEGAIQRGAPLFNNGQAAACAAIYEVAASAILMYEDDLPRDARVALTRAMRESSSMRSAEDRAWAMRRGLDRAAMVLEGPVASRSSENH
jgi:uncharacterized surface protein with fasciclin (FAS1) repeats